MQGIESNLSKNYTSDNEKVLEFLESMGQLKCILFQCSATFFQPFSCIASAVFVQQESLFYGSEIGRVILYCLVALLRKERSEMIF